MYFSKIALLFAAFIGFMASATFGQGWGGGGPGFGGHGPGGPGGPGPGGPGFGGPGGPGGYGGRGEEPPRTAEEAQQRYRRAEFFLSELDANHNGIIEADECSGRRQFFVERMMQRAGLPNTFPVTLDKVKEGLNRYYTSSVQGATPGQPVPGQPVPPGTPGAAAATAASAVPAVPGFGVASGPLPPVLGFGATTVQPVSTTALAPGAAATAKPGAPSSFPATPFSPNDEERKYRDYAKNLMGQYDKNKNGVLDREEWNDMSNNPKAADRNSDGAVTFDELVAWLMSMNKPGGHGGSGSADSGKKSNNKKSAFRIPSAIERLPAGMPDWFLKKDANTDGQVSMAEYTQDWSDSKISEFLKYDLNRDGVITPTECLRVEKEAKTTAKPERGGPPRGDGPPKTDGPPKGEGPPKGDGPPKGNGPPERREGSSDRGSDRGRRW